MQVAVEDLSSVKKVIRVEIPAEQVARELNRVYNDLKKKAKVKGFRPGKAPRSVLERLYKKDAHADVVNNLIQESFMDALKEADLPFIGQPQVEPLELAETEPYRYNATVEIKPAIPDLDFKGIALKKTVYKISDEEIDGQIEALRKRMAQKVKIEEDRAVEKDDFVLMDYEGFLNDETFPGFELTENYTLKIGSGAIAPEIDDAMIGMQPGESREIEVTFPTDFAKSELADKTLNFKVKLHEIQQEKLPEPDAEFAKSLGDFDSVEALRAEIENNLKEGYDKRSEQEINEQIFQALLAQAEFEVPDTLVDWELEGIIKDAENMYSYYNVSMEQLGQSRDMLAQQYRPVAEKQVRRYLILNKIIEQEGLTLSDEDLEKGFEDAAKAYNTPVEQIKTRFSKETDQLEGFKHTLLEKNVLKLIIENSRIEEVEPTPEAQPEDDSEQNTD